LRAQALLFDCDGVLVDSDASVLTAWTRWAELDGLDPLAVFSTVHGRRAAETVAALIARPLQPAALTAINRFELEDAQTVTSIPGAAPLLARLPDRRWAMVTSATRSLADARLAATGLPALTVLVTADDVETGKPDPTGYLLAACPLAHALRWLRGASTPSNLVLIHARPRDRPLGNMHRRRVRKPRSAREHPSGDGLSGIPRRRPSRAAETALSPGSF